MQFKVVILHKTVYTCLNFLSRKFNAWKIPWCNVLKLNSNYDMRSCVESWIRLHLSARWIQPFPNRTPALSRLLCDVMRKTHPFNAKMHGQALVLALRKNIQRERGWRSIKPLTHHRSSNRWEKRCLIKTIEIHWTIYNGYNEYNGYKEYSVHMCTRFFWRTHPLQVLCEGLQNVERACCCPYLQLVSTGRTGTLRRQWQQLTGNGPNLNQHTCSPGPGVFKCS